MMPAYTVRFSGLRAFLDRILDDIARAVAADRFALPAWQRVIGGTAQRLEHQLAQAEFDPGRLTRESSELLGWFRYFGAEGGDAVGSRVQRYAEAIHRAQWALGQVQPAGATWRQPLLVHFRPSGHLYRWRSFLDGTRIVFNTPTLIFDDDLFAGLAGQIAGSRKGAPAVSAAMLSPPYQELKARLEGVEGRLNRTQGSVHDLQTSFLRVNREYFGDAMPRPKLAWSQVLTGRKFGHYDFVDDAVMISRTLDSPRVPAFVIDHVMHHELLHKKHGMQWRCGRRRTHTSAFRAEERRFREFPQADAFLKSLARRRN